MRRDVLLYQKRRDPVFLNRITALYRFIVIAARHKAYAVLFLFYCDLFQILLPQ